MKIIGTGKSEVVIVEMTKDEIANIHGDHSGYSYKIEPGMVYAVSEMYKAACETLDAYSSLRANVEILKKQSEKLLSAMAKKVEKVPEQKK